ncbi:MAG TPA: DUF6132 family protein [Bacteroidales bacterium]|nr:DUF6132 family protein [Bacteroidales bacterium]HPS17426.1 DUF6132 family protein [Bacteroidales bacterium]
MNNSEESKNKFCSFAKNNISGIIGIILGIVAGYIYYSTVGCTSGSCPIKSNPWLTMLWGAIMGYLISGIFSAKSYKCNVNNKTCNNHENRSNI